MTEFINVRDRFKAELPPGFLEAIFEMVHSGARSAVTRMQEGIWDGVYTLESARDSFPHERRAMVEAQLRALSHEFPGVEVESRFNRVGNCHVLIKFGNVMLTASHVPYIYQVVRPAKFRRDYSAMAHGNQGWIQRRYYIGADNCFYVLECDLLRVHQGSIYGIILYDSSSRKSSSIGSVAIGFPNVTCSRYADVMRLDDICPSAAQVETENVEDLANVELLLGKREVVPSLEVSETG